MKYLTSLMALMTVLGGTVYAADNGPIRPGGTLIIAHPLAMDLTLRIPFAHIEAGQLVPYSQPEGRNWRCHLSPENFEQTYKGSYATVTLAPRSFTVLQVIPNFAGHDGMLAIDLKSSTGALTDFLLMCNRPIGNVNGYEYTDNVDAINSALGSLAVLSNQNPTPSAVQQKSVPPQSGDLTF